MRAAALVVAACAFAAPVVGQPSSRAIQASPAFRELAEAFRRGHEGRDVGALERLVHPPGLAFEPRSLFADVVRYDFDHEIERITFAPLARDELLEYRQGGMLWRPTMRPSGRLVVKFVDRPPPSGRGYRAIESSYLVGVRDGRYGIVLAAPVTP